MRNPASYPDMAFICALQRFAAVAVMVVMLSAVLVLCGWALDIAFLKRLAPGLATMKPLTAAAFLLAGAALRSLSHNGQNPGRYRIGRLCAWAAVAIGAAVLIEYAAALDLGIDSLLFHDAVLAEHGLYPGRPAPGTAFCLLLLGLALRFLDSPWRWLAPFFALIGFLIALLAVIGYAYSVSELYRIGPYSSMALHTALLLIALSLGALAARPKYPFMTVLSTRLMGSVMARRLLPMAILIPFGVGWLRLSGQQIGLYGMEFGVALFATSNIIMFAVLVYWMARLLNQTDATHEANLISALGSEHRFRLLAEASPNGLIMTDRSGRIKLANTRIELMFGYPSGGLLEQVVETLIPTRFYDRHVAYREAFALCPEARPMGAGRDLFGLRRDGSTFPVEIGLSPITLENEEFTLASVIDITDRKQAEEKLKKSEADFRDFYDNAPDMYVSVDAATAKIRQCNQTLLKSTAYTQAEVIGRPVFELYHESCMEEAKRMFELFVNTGEVRDVELQLQRKDGGLIDISLNISAVRDAQGHILYSRSVWRDITRRKQAEDGLRRLNEELEQRVLERTAELSQNKAQLTASLKEKEALLKEIHHRVKNNLQIIVSLLQLQSEFLTDPGLRNLILDCRRRVRSMALIHEQLYQGKDLANINFSEYIVSLVNYIRRTYEQAISRVTVNVDIPDMTLDIDRAVPLGLIISELVSNSLKYAFPAQEDNQIGKLWVSATLAPGALTVEVGDSGRGLPDEVDIERPPSMGLQLVQDFVLQLNGHLAVQRRPGTVFTIVVPHRSEHHDFGQGN